MAHAILAAETGVTLRSVRTEITTIITGAITAAGTVAQITGAVTITTTVITGSLITRKPIMRRAHIMSGDVCRYAACTAVTDAVRIIIAGAAGSVLASAFNSAGG